MERLDGLPGTRVASLKYAFGMSASNVSFPDLGFAVAALLVGGLLRRTDTHLD